MPLPEPMLTYHQWSLVTFICWHCLKKKHPTIPISEARLKTSFLNWHPDVPVPYPSEGHPHLMTVVQGAPHWCWQLLSLCKLVHCLYIGHHIDLGGREKYRYMCLQCHHDMVNFLQNTVQCCYNTDNFLQNPHYSSPVRMRYGVSVVILISDSLSTTICIVSYVISW